MQHVLSSRIPRYEESAAASTARRGGGGSSGRAGGAASACGQAAAAAEAQRPAPSGSGASGQDADAQHRRSSGGHSRRHAFHAADPGWVRGVVVGCCAVVAACTCAAAVSQLSHHQGSTVINRPPLRRLPRSLQAAGVCVPARRAARPRVPAGRWRGTGQRWAKPDLYLAQLWVALSLLITYFCQLCAACAAMCSQGGY